MMQKILMVLVRQPIFQKLGETAFGQMYKKWRGGKDRYYPTEK